MKRDGDNYEKANARQWDDVSTTSYTPSISELGTPDDDNVSLLLDLNDFPALPQPPRPPQTPPPAHPPQRHQPPRQPTVPRPSATRPVVPSQQNVRGGGSARGGHAQSQAAPKVFQPQRPSTSSRGRGGSYAHQVNSARHPQATGGSRPVVAQTTRQAAGAPAAVLHEVPSTVQQQNANRARNGSHSSGKGGPRSTEAPASSGPRFTAGRAQMRNENLGAYNAFGEWSAKKLHWAKPNDLVTTRRAIDRNIKTQMKHERERFLQDPVDDDRILAYGFFIWPHDEESVFGVLGQSLAPLHNIRMSQKVYIQCVQEEGLPEVLKISSESANAEAHIMEAIKGIRLVVADARARAVLATPKYFVVPPTASAMRSFIGPKEVNTETNTIDGVEKKKNVMCIGTQLLGPKLSKEEQRIWIRNTSNLDDYIGDFQSRLSQNLMELAPLKYEMRMRLHFGEVIFRRFPSSFPSSQQTLDDFKSMLGHSLVKVEINKELPATTVLKMGMNVTDHPELFRPAEGRSLSLKQVDFKHTEIFHITTRHGDSFRVEANIDTRYDDDYSLEYQLGSYSIYRQDYRNKRIELSTVDPVRGIDYTLQVVTDTPVDIPMDSSRREFEALVAGSIVPTGPRKDLFGSQYPRVRPIHSTELQVDGLVMRSVSQYAFKSSGYIVEVTLDRVWDGPDTKPEPQYVTNVVLFHPQWDHEMESLENSTEGRKWKRNLSNFFEGGFGDFTAAIQTVQEMLVEAAKQIQEEIDRAQAAQVEAEQKRLAAAEAETETWVAAEVERQAAEIEQQVAEIDRRTAEVERHEAANTETQDERDPSRSLLDD